MSSIYTGEKPRIIGATIYALNRTYGLAPARPVDASTVAAHLALFHGGIQAACEDEDAPPAACWHPRSCAHCDRAGAPCGRHYAGDAGHERCTGMHA